MFWTLGKSDFTHEGPVGGGKKTQKQRLQDIQEDLIRLLHKTIDQDSSDSESDSSDSDSDVKDSDKILPVAPPKPHIFLFLADDYGWANIGYHNPTNREVQTPNLNKLMRAGVELDRFYTFNQCGPSRSSLLSGRDPQHVNYVNNGAMSWNESNKVSGYGGVPPNMTLMGTKMKEAGYKTAYTGKWDVGFASEAQMPHANGFDTFLGYLQHANSYCSEKTPFQALGSLDICQSRFLDFWESDENDYWPSKLAGTAYEEELFLKKSLDVIDNHDPKDPLFLFHSSHLLHTPLQIPDEWLANFTDIIPIQGKSDFLRRQYAAMTQYMDYQVGTLVQALKEKDMWKNTLFVFMSDNGGPVYSPASANNWPLRGGKAADFEGGIRVNAFVSGGYIPKKNRGTKVEEYGYVSDWYTTFCNIAGISEEDTLAKEHELPKVDGINLWPMITGSGPGRKGIYVSEKSVIMGRYKLMTGKHGFDLWSSSHFPNSTCGACTYGETGKKTCEDCDQPGPNSGYWLPCEVTDPDDDQVCLTSARGEESFAKFHSYPKSLADLGHWVLDCDEYRFGCLFDIFSDPTEHNNLAHDPRYDSVRKDLYHQLLEFRKTNFNPGRGHENYLACVAGFYHDGYLGPFLDKHGEPLFDLVSDEQDAPSCHACEVKEVATLGQEEFCVHYPDSKRGFQCTPRIDGECTTPMFPARVVGLNAPEEAKFVCGPSGTKAWGDIPPQVDEFYYAETAEEDLALMDTWAQEVVDMASPFTDMCPRLEVQQAKPPVHIRRN